MTRNHYAVIGGTNFHWWWQQNRDSDMDPVDLPWAVLRQQISVSVGAESHGDPVEGTRKWCATAPDEETAEIIVLALMAAMKRDHDIYAPTGAVMVRAADGSADDCQR